MTLPTTIVAAIDSVLDGDVRRRRGGRLRRRLRTTTPPARGGRTPIRASDWSSRRAMAGRRPRETWRSPAAGGELVAFLDADDRWLPRFLSAAGRPLRPIVADGRRVGIVACDAWLVDGAARGVGPHSEDRRQARASLGCCAGNRVYISALVPRAAVDAGRRVLAPMLRLRRTTICGFDSRAGLRAGRQPEPLALYAAARERISSSVAQMAQDGAGHVPTGARPRAPERRSSVASPAPSWRSPKSPSAAPQGAARRRRAPLSQPSGPDLR